MLQPGTPVLDRPTLTALGLQLPIAGDDNFNAVVTVRYRASGTTPWSPALPLFRVHPETVVNYTVKQQFAGSIFDLAPGTTYDIELHATDPDGLDQTFTLTATTRALPHDPITPSIKNVSSSAALQSALDNSQPGDIITLANGFYPGTFGLYSSSGTAANPIVIRGASEDGVILDGGNCTGCNEIEIYGAGNIHIENLTIQNVERGIRFQSNNATANVVRRVHLKNTSLGIGGKGTQYDFYIADNILEGQLLWPHVYSDDNGLFSDRDGIAMFGFGHVVAHNQISGYGDAMKTVLEGARANDFYGNDILFSYDNGVELDASEGNTRAFRNRFMNTYSPLSVQPVHGGPAYLFRNVVVNMVDEQLKFHAEGSPSYSEPSGVLVYHNTFVAPTGLALRMETVVTSHYFAIENNLFIAPPLNGPYEVEWLGVNDHGVFDYNAYFPDGTFRFHNPAPAGYLDTANFASLSGSGYETHGMLANGPLFSNGLTGPISYSAQMAPADVSLAPGSVVIDKGLLLPNINGNYTGSGPDLGALELGCPLPTYGPRPLGIDESNEVVGCTAKPSGAPSVSVAPAVLTFPGQTTSTPSVAQNVTLTNTGTAPLSMSSLWFSGASAAEFSQTNTCGASLSAGNSCSVAVVFTPSAAGTRSATLNVSDSAANSPQSAVVTGTGIAVAAPKVQLSTVAVVFSAITVGTVSAPQPVTITNLGPGVLSGLGLTLSGTNAADFSQSSSCGSTLAANSSCSVSLSFAPSAAGTRSASLSIVSGGGSQPQTVSLTGSATPPVGPSLVIASGTIYYGSSPVGIPTGFQSAAIVNISGATASGVALSLSGANPGDFAQHNSCQSSLPASASCYIWLNFIPTAAGPRSANLTLVANGVSQQTIALVGTGTASLLPSLTINAGTIYYGTSAVGVPTGFQSAVITNISGASVSGIVLSVAGANAGDFGQHNSCQGSLAPNNSCYVWVNFTPTATGARSGSLSVASGAGAPLSVALVGSGR